MSYWYHNSDQLMINQVETQLKTTEPEFESVHKPISGTVDAEFKYFE